MFAQRRILEEIFGPAAMCLEATTGQALYRQHIDNSGVVLLHFLHIIFFFFLTKNFFKIFLCFTSSRRKLKLEINLVWMRGV
jgi:hypothetical protein